MEEKREEDLLQAALRGAIGPAAGLSTPQLMHRWFWSAWLHQLHGLRRCSSWPGARQASRFASSTLLVRSHVSC